MPTILYIAPDGAEHRVPVDAGMTLMEGAVINDVPGIVGQCGGICSCATCHCYVEGGWFATLPPASEGEREMIEKAYDLRPESRLGCQVVVTEDLEGMVVRMPQRQE
jgi:2Fe-2S ferredoxin